MSLVFFNQVLATLGKRVNYDAVVNYAGNAFAKDSWKLIQESNPMLPAKKKPISKGFADLLNQAPIVTVDSKDLGDISWAM